MFEKGRLLKIAASAIALIAVGFATGYYSRVPIRKQILQYRRTRDYKIEQQNLIDNYLNKQAPDTTTETIDGEKWTLHSQRDKVVLLFFGQLHADSHKTQSLI